MADLEGDASGSGQLDQLLGLGERRGQRLLDHRRDPARQEGAGHRAVQGRRDGDRDGVDAIDQVAVIGERLGAVTPGHEARLLDPGVGHADQLDVGDRGEDPGVVLPEVADADHGDAQRHHGFLPRSRVRPCRPSCWARMNSSRLWTSGARWPCDSRISAACRALILAR